MSDEYLEDIQEEGRNAIAGVKGGRGHQDVPDTEDEDVADSEYIIDETGAKARIQQAYDDLMEARRNGDIRPQGYYIVYNLLMIMFKFFMLLDFLCILALIAYLFGMVYSDQNDGEDKHLVGGEELSDA